MINGANFSTTAVGAGAHTDAHIEPSIAIYQIISSMPFYRIAASSAKQDITHFEISSRAEQGLKIRNTGYACSREHAALCSSA